MYEKFYNLSAKPFRLTPDSRFFYNSQSHKRAMSYLLYGIRQGEGFIVITGDVGTGKSTLVGALSDLLKDQNIVTAKIVTTQLDADDLLRVTAAGFGLSYKGDSKADLLKTLETFFQDCYEQGQRVLLLVDEAQNLPPRAVEELRMLSNFQIGGRALLQSFLLGQKEFRNIMRSADFEQLRQRVIAAYHLRPLEADEIRGYVEHRMRLVGWNNDPIFSDDIFVDIHRVTDGVPRRINVFLDRLLLFGSLEQVHVINREVVHAVTDDLEKEDICINSNENNSQAALDRHHNGNGEQRIAELEASLESLGEAVQKELLLIKKALVDAQDRKSAH